MVKPQFDLPGDAEERPLPELRFLKALVTVLAGTMIVGLIAIIALLVIRLGGTPSSMVPNLPATITLPEGSKATAITYGQGFILVVTDKAHVLMFDEDGRMRGQMLMR
jgi:hypothetical protein